MEKNKKLYQFFVCFLCMTIFVTNMSRRPVYADETLPYDTYTYDYYGDVRYTPAAYIPGTTFSGREGESGALKNPMDFTVADDNSIYIADTGNNRIIRLDEEFEFIKEITDYEYKGSRVSFQSPGGVTVAGGWLYIADTGNKRIIALDSRGNTCRIIENPQSEVLSEEFVFEPLKVSVDYAGRVYAIARNTYQGILSFSTENSFRGYTGKIEVKLSPYQKLWRKLATKEQRSKQQLYIPTEFTGMETDQDGFIYATNIDSGGVQSVRRLNPRGEDVIQKGSNEKISGDLSWRYSGEYSGPSRIVDVVVREYGIYSVVDANRGRIFTYDHEGNLLYIFGGTGTQTGTFLSPTAIENIGDKLLVLDTGKNNITLFRPTRYGEDINKAVAFRYSGDESKAVSYWGRVLELDINNELANLGMGKAYLSVGDNNNAMVYFKNAKNQHYYSMAYKRYRNDVLKGNLQDILTVGIILIMGYVLIKKFTRNRRMRREKEA